MTKSDLVANFVEKIFMTHKEVKKYTLAEMKDKYIGKLGTEQREEYESELHIEVLGHLIKMARQEKNLTQDELAKLVGIEKYQISKIESNMNSARIDMVFKAPKALKAEVNFNVKLQEQLIKFV